MTVRTRFAPSPTGYLHIGGARTALFNYLFARHFNGRFILRIEDTDVARSTKESIQAILDGMEWLGLNWDEGPFFQSQFFDLYRSEAKRLLDSELAYRCFCAPEDLEERRKEAMRQGRSPKYDGRCRTMTGIQDRPFAIRFKVPQTRIAFNDLVKGPISFESAEIEDLVIIRSDGTPTYNFCVVVDDATMKITHVIRGDDHIANTPKQMLLYNALGYAPPSFAHLPMILGPDKTRLSKRHGATSVMAYKDMGYLPHALVNYLARLGWAMGDKEVFSMDELIAGFSLDACGKSSGVFNPDKLLWLNHHYIKEAPPEALSMLLIPFLKGLGIDATNDYRLLKITGTLRERAKTLKDMACQAEFYFKDRVQYEEKARKKYLTPETLQFLRLASDAIKTIDDFSATGLQARFEGLLKEKGISLGSIAQPVRVALTGGTVSPGIFEMISAMGREMCLKRLLHAMQSIEGRAETNS